MVYIYEYDLCLLKITVSFKIEKVTSNCIPTRFIVTLIKILVNIIVTVMKIKLYSIKEVYGRFSIDVHVSLCIQQVQRYIEKRHVTKRGITFIAPSNMTLAVAAAHPTQTPLSLPFKWPPQYQRCIQRVSSYK